jgi:hypothetical protein
MRGWTAIGVRPPNTTTSLARSETRTLRPVNRTGTGTGTGTGTEYLTIPDR